MGTSAGFVVVVGGGSLDVGVVELVGPDAVVVAADSGVDAALAAGIAVHHVVGDLDSASAAALADAQGSGATVHRHAADKDATDSELAIDLVLGLHADGEHTDLLVLGGGEGRLDHLLADIALLASDRLGRFDVSARLGPARVAVVRPGRPRSLHAPVGRQVSVLAVGGVARGVTTTGLRWRLHDADLLPGSTRGVSNEVVAELATVAVAHGVVVVVEPGTAAPVVAERSTPYDPTPRLSSDEGSPD